MIVPDLGGGDALLLAIYTRLVRQHVNFAGALGQEDLCALVDHAPMPPLDPATSLEEEAAA